MQNAHPNLGTGERPFPQAKPSPALLEEDEFMRIHGGSGSTLIYRVVTAYWRVPDTRKLLKNLHERFTGAKTFLEMLIAKQRFS